MKVLILDKIKIIMINESISVKEFKEIIEDKHNDYIIEYPKPLENAWSGE